MPHFPMELYFAGLAVNYIIFNTYVLKTQFTIKPTNLSTVCSQYIAVGGVQEMIPRYKVKHEILGDCH